MTSKSEIKEDGSSGSKGSKSSVEVEEKIELGILFKFIKPFDGSREKLNPFISNCQSAFELASRNQKPILFKFIQSQLIDKAETTCSVKEFESFEQFIDFLKQQFGERKHYAHLLTELQDCRQNSAETVNQFALKIETCLAKLLTEINISIPTKRKTELAGRVAAIQDLSLHTFIIGLHPRISQVVRCRNPDSLNSAVNFAVEEEKIIFCIQKKSTYNTHSSNDRFKNANTRRESQPPHLTGSRNYRPDYSKAVNTNDMVCRYCKNIGHTIENCRKRQYNNSRNQPTASTSYGRQANPTQSSNSNPTRKIFNINQDNDE